MATKKKVLTAEERIAAIRQIVSSSTLAKVDNFTVDLFSAQYVVQLYDALSPESQKRYSGLSAGRMVQIAFKLSK